MVRRRTRARKKRTVYQGSAPAKPGSRWVLFVLGALVLVNLYVFVWDKKTSLASIKREAEAARPIPQEHVAAPTVIEGVIGEHDTLGKLMKKHGLTSAQTDEIVRAVSPLIDFTKLRPGQTFRVERGADGRVMRFELDHRVIVERK